MKLLSLLRIITLFTLIPLGIISCNGSPQIYVSSDGSDQNDGSINAPYLSAKRALEEVRKNKAKFPKKNFVINLREGSYRINESLALDSLMSGITIQAYNDEKVVLSGGVSISPELITQSDTHYSIDTPQGTVWKVNLKDADITDFGKLRNVGFSRPYGPAWGEIFVNGKPMHLAQWPNNSMIPMGKVLDPGSKPRDNDFANKGGVIQYDSARVEHWIDEKNPWMAGYFNAGYADDMVKIESIDTFKKTITTSDATLYGFAHGHPWHTWYGVNLLSELDAPTEYYIDRDSGELYFISPEEKVNSLEFSILETPFITMDNANNVTIKNISFEASRGMGISLVNAENVTIESCRFTNLGGLGVAVGMGIEPFKDYRHEGIGTPQSHVVGSLLQHLYSNTTFNRQGGKNNTIINCEFYNLGAGGVSLGGGNRLTLEAGNNKVENCRFHDINRIEKTYRPAVHLTGVGNIIRNCEMFDLPSMAILMHGNNHLVEYNYIHDVCMDAEDMGAFYYGRDPSERGTVLQYNYFANIPDQYNTSAVYHDDAACGLTVTGNIFNHAGKLASLIGGGSDNIYTNNIFLNGKQGIRIGNRLSTWAKWLLDEGGLFQKRLEEVNYQQPPYSEEYPSIVNYFDKVDYPTGNRVSGNLFANMNEVFIGDKEWVGWESDNVVTDKKIEVTKNGKLSFSDSGYIFEQIPELKTIPLDKIGLYKNQK